MAEIEIKRVNFFDGQFLKEGEFLDLDAYHRHMRRRWAYVMFDKSGVIQSEAEDLTIVVEPSPPAPPKTIRAKAGMAIGKNVNALEAKEIVHREDDVIDLTTQGIAAGGTAWVTLHYEEEKVADPPSEGDVPGETRIREHARVKIHASQPPATNPANGEPFIVLGTVTFDTMTIDTSQRQVAFLKASLLASVPQAPQITLAPNQVTAGGQVTINVTSSGGFNLSGVTVGNVTILPNTGISNLAVSNPQATSLKLTFTLAANAPAGARTVTITVGGVSAQASFTVQAANQPPTITSLPAAATRNQLMTIGGTNFIAPVTVTFTGGAVKGPNFNGPGESLSPTQIVLIMPGTGASTGPITITAAGGMIQSAASIVVL
jgi:hypothetical protein